MSSKSYSIYTNPEHIHFLISRSASISEEKLASIVAESSELFINENKLVNENFHGKIQHPPSRFQNPILIKFVNIFLINRYIIKK